MVINQYIRAAAKLSDLSKFTHFNTAVEALGKQDDNWMLTSRKLLRNKNNKLTFSTQTQASVPRLRRACLMVSQAFDAVIVASGHYHTMKIPDIPGLKEWKSIWPDRVHHSKGYRRASDYKNQNVLLIGAGTSSFDIAREIGSVANKVYQSSRGGLFDLPLEFLSPNAQRVGEVSGFNIDSLQTSTNLKTKKPLYNDQPIPFSIYLKDGTALHSIHQVVICTGYHCSVPFLSYLHDDSMLGEASTSPTVLVTDGTSFHNLHKDIFYIPDPTLAFVGIPYYSATFTLFEFQAMAVAAVFAEYADLPIEVDMRTEYERRVAIKGHGRSFHSVKDKEIEYVDDLLAWINEEGAKRGRLPVKGHTDNFRKVYENRKQLMRESLLKRNEQGRIQTA
ncbi:hypothetical protein MMC10_002022 [Thelotrema lepadinum]|nr:hypothetical protein [Thelotrema lepadinum]